MSRVFSYLKDLKGNAKVCIVFHPLWSIPYAIYTFYLGLYLQLQGISDTQLGMLMMVGNIVGIVASFASAPIVDRLGRRNTTLIFDLISSALPPAIYLFTASFGWAMAAMVATNLNRIMSIGYYLTMIEDSSDETRVVALNMFNLITVAAGLLVPLAGIIIAAIGLIRGQRLFLAISAVSMTILAIARHLLLKETSTGIQVRKQIHAMRKFSTTTKNRFIDGLLNNFAVYPQAFAFLREHPEAARAMRTNVLFYTYYVVGTSISLYFTPYFSRHLQLSASEVSIVGGLYAGGTLVALPFLNPLYNNHNSAKFFSIAAFISLLGFGMLASSPVNSLWFTLPAVVFIAVGFGMMRTATDANFASETSGVIRSGLYALSYVLSALLSIVVLWLCAQLYSQFPPWLFILSGILILGIFIDQFVKAMGKQKVETTTIV
ncbi:MAG: MFS transporter [Sphaerochaetaceae bacterium]|nr:MFS transporter [Sphaerochaetaceae bacterium]